MAAVDFYRIATTYGSVSKGVPTRSSGGRHEALSVSSTITRSNGRSVYLSGSTFRAIKQEIAKESVMRHFDFKKESFIGCDPSDTSLQESFHERMKKELLVLSLTSLQVPVMP